MFCLKQPRRDQIMATHAIHTPATPNTRSLSYLYPHTRSQPATILSKIQVQTDRQYHLPLCSKPTSRLVQTRRVRLISYSFYLIPHPTVYKSTSIDSMHLLLILYPARPHTYSPVHVCDVIVFAPSHSFTATPRSRSPPSHHAPRPTKSTLRTWTRLVHRQTDSSGWRRSEWSHRLCWWTTQLDRREQHQSSWWTAWRRAPRTKRDGQCY
jgi:hypothetical protein